VDKSWWQVKLCDPSLTRAVPECFRDEFVMIKHYTNLRLLYFTLLYKMQTDHYPMITLSGRAVKKGIRVSRCNINKAVEDSRLPPRAQCTVRFHSQTPLCTVRLAAENVSHREATQTAASAEVLPLSALPPAD